MTLAILAYARDNGSISLHHHYVKGIKSERLGLAMISASLVVITVILLLFFYAERDSREAQIRSQGLSLVRQLVDVPYNQLVPGPGQNGALDVLNISQNVADFAYVMVAGPDGAILAEASTPGVIAPRQDLPQRPISWPGERRLTLSGNGRDVVEFFAPIINNGDLVGNLRLGYFQPGIGLSIAQLPFFAALALPIFLLTPLFYFLIQREIRPLKVVTEEVRTLIKDSGLNHMRIEATGELGDFVANFNGFVEAAKDRIEHLETSNADLETSHKLLSYKKTRIQSILEAIPEAVIILDEDGKASYANNKVTTLLGISPRDILGKPVGSWCSDPEILGFLSQYEGSQAGNVLAETGRFMPGGAPEKRLATKAYPLFSPRNGAAVQGTLIVLHDITKETLAEESRANFIAHVAHEFKSPLNTMALYSEALIGEDGQNEDFRIEAHNAIKDEVERLATLVDNLLSITKMEMGSLKVDRKRVRLNDLLKDAFEHVSNSAGGEDLEFKLDLPPEIAAVSVDKDLLLIAINNLLVNAIKYAEPGGTISMSLTDADEVIQIRVRDTGIGIASKDHDRIFEKFYRSDDQKVRQRSGHGLGLSLAKDIIEIHHGRLTVNSELGKGSEFVIDLRKDHGLLQKAI